MIKYFLKHDHNVSEFSKMIKIFEDDSRVASVLILSSDIKFDKSKYDPILKATKLDVMGGVFPEIIFEGKRIREGIVMVGFPNKIKSTIIENLDEEYISKKIAGDLAGIDPNGKSFFIFIDALINEKSNLFDGLYNNFGTIPNYIGGGTGSLDFTSFPTIFTNRGILEKVALVAVMDLKASIGVAHGWEPITEPLKVTEASQNKIISLNWKPAMEVYRQALENHTGTKLDFSDFLDTAKCYPFGISKLDNEMVVRDPYQEEDGVIYTLDQIEQGSHVAILYGNMDGLIDGADKAYKMAIQGNAQEDFSNLFLIDCISRVLFMNEKFDEEIQKLDPRQESFGALTLGEIANSGDSYLEVFNKTAVVFAIYE